MALFEIGKVHFYNYPPEKEGKVEEKMVLGIALCGEKDKIHWSSKTKFFDFFTLKGIVEALLQEIGIKEKCKEEISHYPMFHPYQQLMITLEGEVLAVLGQMHPQFLSHFSLQQPLFFCELHLDLLLKQEGKEKKYKDLPVFPASHRDWTLTLSEQIPFSLVCNHLEKFKPSILEKMELIDLFQKEGEKRLHLTFRFTYRDSKKTLAMENVEKAHNFFTQAVTKELSSL